MMESAVSTLRYAARSVFRSPGLAAVVTLTLALGIGANATMFGVVDRAFLRPPAHVSDPERLMRVLSVRAFGGQESRGPTVSYPVYTDLRDNAPGLEHVAAYAYPQSLTLGLGPDARPVRAQLVSAGYFATLGVRPALGRFFRPDEDQLPAGAPVVVVGDAFWRRQLAADRAAVGQAIQLGAERYTIVGVAPRGFAGLGGSAPDLWLPITASTRLRAGSTDAWARERNMLWMEVVARPRAGVSREQAQAQATAAMRAGNPDWASYDPGFRAELRPVQPPKSAVLRKQEDETPVLTVSRLLGGVSILVLLIACANVANLLLARGASRRREIAVRLALGISRRRLVAQLVAESMVLAALGGAAALLVTYWGGDLMRAALFAGVDFADKPVDARVLAFTAAATLLAGLATGLVPALQASRPELVAALRQGARGSTAQHGRTRIALLVLQSALCVVLLVGTGLFVRSLRNVSALRLGIDTDRVLVARMNLASVGYKPPAVDALYRRMEERVRTMPGVAAAAVGVSLPFSSSYAVDLRVPGLDSLPSLADGGPYINGVTPGWFATMGTRILRGRGFTDADDQPGAPRVVVVNESIARLYWPGQDALGKCMRIGSDTAPCSEVVGVAENARRQRIVEREVVQYYVPLSQAAASFLTSRVLFVRPAAGRDPGSLVAALQREMQGAAPNLPYADVVPLRSLLDGEMRPWRLGSAMFGAFGLLALVLAAVGLYGVIAYGVSQRTHEMGVRVALGAQRGDVLRLVVGQGLRVTLVGVGIGVAAALALGPLAASLLFDVKPTDPAIFGGVVATLFVVAALASYVPARRATKVDPMVALRTD
ncbi:MAG TPA: ABC transporter permease [Gemmatimonadaceae bacterium]|nr:ABC transporter permease [Gemmatimonadaceae bacterium]